MGARHRVASRFAVPNSVMEPTSIVGFVWFSTSFQDTSHWSLGGLERDRDIFDLMVFGGRNFLALAYLWLSFPRLGLYVVVLRARVGIPDRGWRCSVFPVPRRAVYMDAEERASLEHVLLDGRLFFFAFSLVGA